MAKQEPEGLWVDGERYTVSDLTFKEQRELRQIVRDVTGDPEHGMFGEDCDFIPAFVTVIKRRENPAFKVEDADQLKDTDLEKPARPTKART